MHSAVLSALLSSLLVFACPVLAGDCLLPDNGSGTVDFPPDCPDGYEGRMVITSGLPPGSTIEIDATLTDYSNIVRTAGGSLGGEVQVFDALLHWVATGTGDLTGFNRTLAIPVACEVHTGPGNPGAPVQIFAGDLYAMTGELFGDPDFCTLRIRAGTSQAMPGPGSNTLTRLPGGDFAVDSFFDITYEIEFEGCPGSPLEDYWGITQATDRFQAGAYFTAHSCVLPNNGSGTLDLPPDCPDGYQGEMIIYEGLPPGTTIEIDATLTDYANIVRTSGGSLGGEVQSFDATLYWVAVGTGDLTGFSRTLAISVECEIHTAPRTPGDSVQTFAGDLYSMTGELFGDPDFCTLRIRAGTSQALPSPGSNTLTRLPSGDFAVDSFFDITYQIEFEGCPGSPLEDYMGTTQSTDRFLAGEYYTTHPCVLPDNGSGTVDLPLDCPNGYRGEMIIVNGLPPGATIGIDAAITGYSNVVRTPGGSLGGEVQDFDAVLYWDASGTGDLDGFVRTPAIPVHCIVHTAARTPGDSVQAFVAAFVEMTGELFGDPDFCTLRIRAGSNHSLPSPGGTVLTRLSNGDFAVDSFFDITYEIEFEGCPGSALEDYWGITQATGPFTMGGDIPVSVATREQAPLRQLQIRSIPNPFNPATTIEYDVPQRGAAVRVDIYDVRGRIVKSLVRETADPGRSAAVWDGKNEGGRDVASGIYFAVLRAGSTRSVTRMVLLK